MTWQIRSRRITRKSAVAGKVIFCYANLKRTDIESNDLKLVARALLPAEIKEGSKLRYEMLTYYMED